MKIIRLFLILAVLVAAFSACKKYNGPAVPDGHDFSVVDSGTYLPGGRATITVNSATLADGTYTLYYFMFPSGFVKPYSTPVHATLVMSNHTGTFLTDPLDSSDFMILQTDSIVNQAGGGANVNSRFVTLTDSTGMMTVQMNGRDTFKTTSVIMTNESGRLHVVATSPVPGIIGKYRYVTLYINDSLGVKSFSDGSDYNSYSVFIDSATIPSLFVHGQITLTTLAPLLTGSFSVTCADSTKMSGTFSCRAL